MGNKFEVLFWHKHWDFGWMDERFWAGEHLIPALYNWYRAHKKHPGCVSLKWRGL